MSENGVIAYDLAGNWCEECGRAKSYRLWPGTLTGCKTCDEAITRHRCTGRPAVTDRAPGQKWECPDCGSFWMLAEEEDYCPDCCGDCGHKVVTCRWNLAEKGDRMATAPRFKPQPFAPFRNLIPRPLGPLRREAPDACYRMSNGSPVHVKPGCQC